MRVLCGCTGAARPTQPLTFIHLLVLDYFEVGLLLGACFLVNYVTVDAKTNVSEGLTMIAFYAMIVSHPIQRFESSTDRTSCLLVGNSDVVLPRTATGRIHAQLPWHCRGSRSNGCRAHAMIGKTSGNTYVACALCKQSMYVVVSH